MHHALKIQEILLNILDCCSQLPRTYSAELAVLARTCRTFKEPALDALWQELFDLSPLARCLPDASHLASPVHKCYAFSRPLTQAEWDTLQSYAHRIRTMQQVSGLGRKSIRIISELPTNEPLFRNLRRLRFVCTVKTAHLLRLPLPSIISLDFEFINLHVFKNAVLTISKFFPTLRGLSIRLKEGMDTDSFVQLSCMMLTQLQFYMGTDFAVQVAAHNLPHHFPHLLDLGSSSASLPEISLFFSKTRMPSLAALRLSIRDRPFRQDFSSLLASLQKSGLGSAFDSLSLMQLPHDSTETRLVLGIQDFQPLACMASNLRHIDLNMQCQVDLDDSDMLALASAWPRLEHFFINAMGGWNTPGGITPTGLVRLLKSRPSLKHVALALDTRHVIPESGEIPDVSLSHELLIDIVDSIIEADAVPAMADFFARLSPFANPLSTSFWSHWMRSDLAIHELYYSRWLDVQQRIDKAIGKDT